MIIGLLAGLGIALALLLLIKIRNVSPLLAIRASCEDDTAGKDKLRWILYGIILLAVTAFAISQTNYWIEGVAFTGGLLAAFSLLAGFAKLLMISVKNSFLASWGFVWRQSLANLYRPQ